MKEDNKLMQDMKKRDFAYSDIFRRESGQGTKNESNCTVFLKNGAWFTLWSQGTMERNPDERMVGALSFDEGRTWTRPFAVQDPEPEHELTFSYGIPFVVPDTGRLYIFFFSYWNTNTEDYLKNPNVKPDPANRKYPEHESGHLYFIYSDDDGKTWSKRKKINLPHREIFSCPDRIHAWVNHPLKIMPGGQVIFSFTGYRMDIGPKFQHGMNFRMRPSENNIVLCENILSEKDADKLSFKLLPEGEFGIRVDIKRFLTNKPMQKLHEIYGGDPEKHSFNFEELTVVPLADSRWLGVGRTKLGSPCYTISSDGGYAWSSPEPLRYSPGGDLINHPMTMCPIEKTADGRFVLLFNNNDGSERGSQHVWDGFNNRNPLWIVVGKEIPGEKRNGGLVFGKPAVVAEADSIGKMQENKGDQISMPQFFERNGKYFICYNIKKYDILIDQIPKEFIDSITPWDVDKRKGI